MTYDLPALTAAFPNMIDRAIQEIAGGIEDGPHWSTAYTAADLLDQTAGRGPDYSHHRDQLVDAIDAAIGGVR